MARYAANDLSRKSRDSRKSRTLDKMSNALFEEFRKAIDDYERKDDDFGDETRPLIHSS